MKAQYVKPLIFVESFSLTQSIAIDCGDDHQGTLGQSNHYNGNTCEWLLSDEDLPMFFVINEKCIDSIVEGDEVEGFCYNNLEGGQAVFSSM